MEHVEPKSQPEPPRQASVWLEAVKLAEQEGDLFHAYDLAARGLQQHPQDLALKHRAVLCLASSGATGKAWAVYRSLELDRLDLATGGASAPGLRLDLQTLPARLVKDAALALPDGEARRDGLLTAARLYEDAFADACRHANREAYYPAVNAATLRLLTGDRDGAQRLAHAALAAVNAIPTKERGYYELASAVEAQLVLGETARAGELAALARSRAQLRSDADYRALASTVRQLRLVLSVLGMTDDWLVRFAPPKVIHYLGHIIASPGHPGRFPAEQEDAVAGAIARKLASDEVGFGHGSLAAGSDILFAEALLRRGASIHVVMPCAEADFVARSVMPAGGDWIARYEHCRDRASSVRFATTDKHLGDDALFTYGGQLAMGLALLRAQHLCAEVEQIAVWDGQPPIGPAGTAIDVVNWRRSGKTTTVIPCGSGVAPAAPATGPSITAGRRPRAMLFGDIKGFSKLTDAQLPRFVTDVLGALAATIDLYRDDLLTVNTWGDGLFIVFDDAGKAASCALALQLAIGSVDTAEAGLPEMAMRIGVHLGPTYAGVDPILRQPNFFGAHVSRAARIEPVTPEGCVYVTETTAAILALHNADQFICDYVGMTEAAKGYGIMRMFLLRRASVSTPRSIR